MKTPNFAERATVFDFKDYKTYLVAWIESRANAGRGEKSRLAEKARCHLAYISQVLTGSAHFSLEQADALNEYLGHTEDEATFFILLVERGRAGTPSLAKFFDRRIQRQLEQRAQLKNRFTDKKALGVEQQTLYYSHWAYCAIHMAVLNPDLRDADKIAGYFALDLAKTKTILEFLNSVGLVVRKGGNYLPGDVRIHLAHDSPMISKHHTNFRMQAIRALEHDTPNELHYSGVISVARSDLPRVREILMQALDRVRATVKDSRDETVYCYAVDLFGLGRAKK